jgi:acetylornithine deacetylase/succinyl-diaminopimelate desuccinylase-like protein
MKQIKFTVLELICCLKKTRVKNHKFLLFFFFLIIYNSTLFSQVDNKPEDFLSKIIQIKSITGNENKVGNYILDYCKDLGFHTKKFSNDSSFNFSASLYPLEQNKPNIIFLSHLDVVPEGDSCLWKYKPFSGEIAENFVYGRGAIDCKGLLTMQLLAMQKFLDSVKTENFPYNVTFLAVSGEETSEYSGANFVTKNYLKELNPIVIYGEGGSGMQNVVPSKPEQVVFGISVSEKKALWLKLEANNKSNGHGATPPVLYANKKLIKALIKILDEKRLIKFGKVARKMFKELGKLEGGISGFVLKHINWDVFWPFVRKNFSEDEIMHTLVYNTFVITGLYNNDIEGISRSSNIIADKAYAILDCRLLPETNSERFIKKIENIVGTQIKVSVIEESPSAEPSDYDNKFYNHLKQATKEVYTKSEVLPLLFPATTDNNYFRRFEIPVYGFLPVIFSDEEINSVHNINEKISIMSLYQGIDVYTKLISKLINDNLTVKKRRLKLN